MNAIERIISAIPAEAEFSEADRNEARTLLLACVLWALPHDGPGQSGIEQLRGLTNGYGCWLSSVRQGIDAANLTTNERGFFFGGFGMASALLLSFTLAKQDRNVAAAAARPPKKRTWRKTTQPSTKRHTHQAGEIVLPPEWCR